MCLEKKPEEFTQVEGFNPTFVSFGEKINFVHGFIWDFKNTKTQLTWRKIWKHKWTKNNEKSLNRILVVLNLMSLKYVIW